MAHPRTNAAVDALAYVGFVFLTTTGLLLRYQLPPGSGGSHGVGAGQAAEGNLEVMETPPTELWPWILALLLVVVLMESWVGNWHLRIRRGIAT